MKPSPTRLEKVDTMINFDEYSVEVQVVALNELAKETVIAVSIMSY